MTVFRIMVVDDDAEMRAVMTAFLQRNGYMVVEATNQRDIDAHLAGARIDLILLDVMLEKENGVDICRNLRQQLDVPIIMVSTLSADHQRMSGYDVGADDYIAKPFNPELLLARVKAVLRRGQRSASLSYRRITSSFLFNGWRYNAKRGEVHAPDGYQVALSKREAGLLKVFLANPHIPLKREEIAAAMDITQDMADKGEAATGRAIDMLVKRLRTKIETKPKDPTMIRTERGTGYIFGVDVTEAED